MYIYTELSYFLFTIALVTPHKLNIILEALLVTNNVFRWSKLSTIVFLVGFDQNEFIRKKIILVRKLIILPVLHL